VSEFWELDRGAQREVGAVNLKMESCLCNGVFRIRWLPDNSSGSCMLDRLSGIEQAFAQDVLSDQSLSRLENHVHVLPPFN